MDITKDRLREIIREEIALYKEVRKSFDFKPGVGATEAPDPAETEIEKQRLAQARAAALTQRKNVGATGITDIERGIMVTVQKRRQKAAAHTNIAVGPTLIRVKKLLKQLDRATADLESKSRLATARKPGGMFGRPSGELE